MSGQVTTNNSVLQLLVEKLSKPVDDETRRRAVSHVIDWIGCAALGARSVTATGFANLTARGASGPCRVIGTTSRDWWSALQLNAAVGNILEMDDLHRTSILHPGPIIVPAAVAVAELVGASSAQFLGAIVRGYEATIRIGRALGPAHYTFFHSTSTAGAFGAATAAADILGLGPDQFVWALANAGSRTGGLWQMRHENCETKSLHNAQASQTGVQSALLALEGVRGPPFLLEGPQGLFAGMASKSNAYDVMSNFDDNWLIHEVSFKPWPACRHAHPAIDAAIALRASISENIGPEDIVEIRVDTYRSAVDFCDQPNPETELQAKFSLQHCVATVFAKGPPVLSDFSVANLHSQTNAVFRSKVKVTADQEYSARFPQHYGARVSINLADGRKFEVNRLNALGDPEIPLSEERVAEKACSLLTAAGAKNPESLIASAHALANDGTVIGFTSRWP